MRPNILGLSTDDEECLGGRQNSLSRAQLIIKAAPGTVKLSRSAIRELRERVESAAATDFKVRASEYDTLIPIPLRFRSEKRKSRRVSWRIRWQTSDVNPKSADGSERRERKSEGGRWKVGQVYIGYHGGVILINWTCSPIDGISKFISPRSTLL